MLVNARLSYISVDVLHYSSGGQVILTVNCLALLHFRPRITLCNRDRTRPYKTINITIKAALKMLVKLTNWKWKKIVFGEFQLEIFFFWLTSSNYIMYERKDKKDLIFFKIVSRFTKKWLYTKYDE
jgi:hypothetical protein